MRGPHSHKEKNWAQILLRQGMPQSGGHARREALLLPVVALGESTETEVDCCRAASEVSELCLFGKSQHVPKATTNVNYFSLSLSLDLLRSSHLNIVAYLVVCSSVTCDQIHGYYTLPFS